MPKSPYFSIIIPTYHAGCLLGRALSSVFSQSFSDLEVIIVDGLSTDNTVEIAMGFKSKRIKVVSEKDHGIYDAMNKGIKVAQGEWLYFLGSDDAFFSDKILEMVAPSLTKGNDVVYGNVHSSRFGGVYDGEFDNEKILNKNICHQSIFFHKSVFDTVGDFDLRYKSHADWEHNMRWFLSDRIKKKYIDVVIAHYADGGFSSRNPDRLFHDHRVLTYLTHGKKVLSPVRKLAIMIKEVKRAVKSLDYKLLLNLFGSLIRTF
jgi:glycosyltransferase involved in cell wall biosynthesis